jgi:hypothetical protein
MIRTVPLLAIIATLALISTPVESRLEVVSEITTPNPHNRILLTTSLCDDYNCLSCNTRSKHTCLNCRSTYERVLNNGNYVCASCTGCKSVTECSMNSGAPKSCNQCNSGYKRVYHTSRKVYYCQKEFRSSNAGLGLIVLSLIWIGAVAFCCAMRWCCNQMMHANFSYEKVVLTNQPPPY